MTLATLWFLLWPGPPAPIPDDDPDPGGRERLEAIVHHFASPAFEGRAGEGARAAGDELIERLDGLGLEPLFEGRFDQPFRAGELRGRNIGAALEGSDPELADEWVILSAHYDHLGIRGGRLFPGADDNATGMAMVLEVARRLRDHQVSPRRGVMFVFFDLEEPGLLGSRHFVRSPPRPLEEIRLFLTADMLGRALFGVCEPNLFVMGTEHAPALRPWVEEAAGGLPIRVGTIGADVLVVDRSDYGPFRARRVPFLFFSTGESPDYHTPRDVPEAIDFAKLAAGTTLVERIVRRAAGADDLPGWTDEHVPWIEEAETLRDVYVLLLEHAEELGVSGTQRFLMKGSIARVDAIVEAGTITPAQRSSLLRVAQFILASL